MLCCRYNCLKEKISTFQEKLLCEFLLVLLGWIFCDVKEPGKPFDVNFPQDYITSYQAFCFGPIRRKLFRLSFAYILFDYPKMMMLDKAPRFSIRIDIWILLSDTICQPIQFYSNSEVALLSRWCSSLYAEWCQSKPWKSFTFTFFPDKCNGELGKGGWEQNISSQLKTSWTNQHQESEKYRKRRKSKMMCSKWKTRRQNKSWWLWKN